MPHPELPPHAPMPGAPPYPQREPPAPSPIGRPSPARTRFGTVLAAAAIWAAVNALLVLVGPAAADGGRTAAGIVGSALLTAVLGWLAVRRRRCPFWVLLLVIAPVYWTVRALVGLPLG